VTHLGQAPSKPVEGEHADLFLLLLREMRVLREVATEVLNQLPHKARDQDTAGLISEPVFDSAEEEVALAGSRARHDEQPWHEKTRDRARVLVSELPAL